MAATVAGVGEVKVGRPSFCGITLPESLLADPQWHSASVVAVAANGEAVGAFAVADALKDDSSAAVHRLQQQGIAVHIMSGDHIGVVAHVAQLLGFVDHPGGDCGDIDQLIDGQLARVRARLTSLQALERQLSALRARCDSRHEVHACGILEELVSAAHGEACACHDTEGVAP